MAIHYEIPTTADIANLIGDRDVAVSVYVETSPKDPDPTHARTVFKSAFDDALNQLEAAGVSSALRKQVAAERDAILANGPWDRLARSLAVFVAPGFNEVYVLPSRLETHFDAGTSFTLGQLWRSVTQSQEAFALTLSTNEWKLWHATPTDRATEIQLKGDHPANADQATNSGAGERKGDDYEGDPYDLYAKRVAEAARSELAAIDPNEKLPLFVFTDDKLASRFADRKDGRQVVTVPGSPDRLSATEIDEVLRDQLGKLHLANVKHDLEHLENIDQSLVERDLAAIAHLAATGGVETLWFDFTVDVFGELDPATGNLKYHPDDSGAFTPGVNELYGQIAQIVASHGGQVFAVRGSEVGEIWKSPVVAKLRFAM